MHKRQEYYLNNKEDIEAKRIKGNLNYYDNANKLVKLKKEEQYIWLKEVNSQCLLSQLMFLDTAYKDFFKKKSRFPKYKKKDDKQSFHIPQHIKIENNRIYIPKFKEGIRFKKHRELEGKICNLTISKNNCNQYFVSIIVEKEIQELENNNNKIGIDLGIKDLAVCSNGEIFENHIPYKKHLKKLKFLQRQLRRQKKGSKRREKRKLKIAKLYNKISSIRNDYLHKITNKITNENQVIVIEDLGVKNMIKNHNLAQSISDASFGKFRRQLEYKSKWKGRQLIVIDRFFPSSKMCSKCGYINEELTLKDREWICPNCGTIHNRDYNASLNILKQGLNMTDGIAVKKQVEVSSIEEPMKLEAQSSLEIV